jgi:hypothetical protein
MFKIFTMFGLLSLTHSQQPNLPVALGGSRDAHGCLIGAGYTWCDSHQSCIRQWLTPCSDNYNGCTDCLSKQRKGMNIACPVECNVVVDQWRRPIAPEPLPHHQVDPLPPAPVAETPCPDVMCMMYCENGFQQDQNGCNMCSCLSPIAMTPPEINGLLNSVPVPGECPIPITYCDNLYACPKVTEVTHCSQDGISGYTTYQLSLVIHNPEIRNIYAIYGDTQFGEHPLSIPPAHQGTSIYGSNLGGVLPEIISLNRDAAYDSWLTIGLTEGDRDNKLSSVGIDFNSWTETNGIYTTNAAVFLMNSDVDIIDQEISIAQLTIPDNLVEDVIINVQGKLHCDKMVHGSCMDTHVKTWQETQITFHLEKPQIANPDVIPNNCLSWFDGCNTCLVREGVLRGCSRLMCFTEGNPHCLSFSAGH